MRTVGDVLKDARLRHHFSIVELEQVTRIKAEHIEALEESAYDRLPPPTFTKGFIRNIGKELGLNVAQLLALYRREYDERERSVLKLAPEPLSQPTFRITQRSVVIGAVLLFLALFFGYLYREYSVLAGAPLLIVTEPMDQTQLQGPTVTVAGKTYPDARIAINDQEVIVAPDGTFRTEVKSTQSLLMVTITATNKRGRKNETTRTVRVLNPEG